MAAKTAAEVGLLTQVPAHQRARIFSGMRWSLWLAVFAFPFSYGTTAILARVSPEAIGTYGLLSVYIGIATGFFYLGGDPVLIRYIPLLDANRRPAFLASYFLVALVGLAPWLGIAFLWPKGLHYVFGDKGSPDFFLLMLCLSPIYVALSMVGATLKGMFEIGWAQALTRLLTFGSFLIYAVLFLFHRSILANSYTEVVWGVYLGLCAVGTIVGLVLIVRITHREVRRMEFRFVLPPGFWRYVFSLQQNGIVWLLIGRVDYILILNFGGLEVLGQFVAIASIMGLLGQVNMFFIDTLLPSLTNLIASRNMRGASQVFSMYMRILLLVSVATTSGLILFSGVFLSILGPRYQSFRTLVPVLALLFGMAQPGSVGATLLSSVGKPQRGVWVGVGHLSLFATLFLVVWPRWHLTGVILADGVSTLISYLTLLTVAKYTAQIHFSVTKDYLTFGLVAMLACAVSVGAPSMPLGLVVAVWLGLIASYLALARYRYAECLRLARCFLPDRAKEQDEQDFAF